MADQSLTNELVVSHLEAKVDDYSTFREELVDVIREKLIAGNSKMPSFRADEELEGLAVGLMEVVLRARAAASLEDYGRQVANHLRGFPAGR